MNTIVKKSIAILITAIMVLAMAIQSFAAPLSYTKPAATEAGTEKVTGTWSKDAAGSWHFNSKTGAAKNGWYYLNTTNTATDYNWFYFTNGVMNTGWVQDKKDPSVWYYTGSTKDSSEGGLVKGWITDPHDGKKYYTDPSTGIMCYGWKQLDGVWYYFGEKQYENASHPYGAMYVNEKTPDGYYVGSSGAWGQTASSGSSSSSKPAPKPDPTPVTTYTVTFDMQGHGTQIPQRTGVASGSKIIKPTDPTETGLKFKGWYKEAACTNAWDFDVDTVAANTKLYAKWAATIGYVLGENFPKKDNAWTSGQNSICYYQPHFIPQMESLYFENTGLDLDPVPLFLFEEIAETGEDYIYQDSRYMFTLTFNMNGNDLERIVFDADETAREFVKAVEGTYTAPVTTCTVTFDMQGHGTQIDPFNEVSSGSKITEPSPAPEATGYTFGGWFKDEGCTSEWTFETDTVTEDTTLYAKWTPFTYYVKFDANGGSGSMGNQTFIYGVPQKLTQNTFTKGGFSFICWSQNEDGAEPTYSDEEEISTLGEWDGHEITLYAQWEEISSLKTVRKPISEENITVKPEEDIESIDDITNLDQETEKNDEEPGLGIPENIEEVMTEEIVENKEEVIPEEPTAQPVLKEEDEADSEEEVYSE